jgi:hypothetical protein
LGDEKNRAVRLGGIYALERIAKNSETDYWSVMEVLSAYVREAVSVKNVQDPQPPGQTDCLSVKEVLTALMQEVVPVKNVQDLVSGHIF